MCIRDRCQRVWRCYSPSLGGESGPGTKGHSQHGNARSTGDSDHPFPRHSCRHSNPCFGYRVAGHWTSSESGKRKSPCHGARFFYGVAGPGNRASINAASARERRRRHGRCQWRASKPRAKAWRGDQRRRHGRRRSQKEDTRQLGRRRRPFGEQRRERKSWRGWRCALQRRPGLRAPTMQVSLALSVACGFLQASSRECPEEMPGITDSLQGVPKRNAQHHQQTKAILLGYIIK
eukprot:2620783-Amphidinium_carterae.1